MPVPYGFGVGDFVAVGTLAWNVYKSCKAAPGSFDNISTEVLSLHAVLKEAEETLFPQPLPPERTERLKLIKEGCDKVLVDLQILVEKYESLGTQSKRTWDRMRWGNEDIAEIRARLTSNVSILAAFISTSQATVETKLDKFIEEFRQGKRETSVMSTQTVDSLSADDRAVWRTIRKELEEIGINVAAFEANRNFIFDWFVRAVEAGDFDERNCSDSQELPSSDDDASRGKKQQLHSHNVKVHSPEKFDQIVATQPRTPRTPVPRVAVLLAGLSRPRQRFIKAVAKKEISKALKILKDEASFQLLDLRTLNQAFWMTGSHKRGSDLLIAEIIARGCNVNYISKNHGERTPLWNSVANGSFDTVQLLIENGVDVNYTGTHRGDISPGSGPGQAYDFAPRAALKQDTTILRLLLSSGVNVNARYLLPEKIFSRGYVQFVSSFPQSIKISLIHEATFSRLFEAMEALLEHGADIDILSPRCGTALMLALSDGAEDVARFLLTKGADPNIKAVSHLDYHTVDGKAYGSSIEAAIIGRRSSLVKLLLERGVMPDDAIIKFAHGVIMSSSKRKRRKNFDEDRKILRLLEDVLQVPACTCHPNP